MKERQQAEKLECSFTNEEKFFLAIGTVVFVLVMLTAYIETRELRMKCIAEQIIDEQNNPGKNFDFETEIPSDCDIFIYSRHLQGARRFRGKDIFFP